MIRKPKEDPQESGLDVKGAIAALIGDPNILITDLDAHLDELRRLGFPETLIEDFRSRLGIGDSEPS